MEEIIKISNLKKNYHKARGVDDVNLIVRKGQLYGFVGPNGAGKSTTIKVLLDFIKPNSGNASILGLNCQKDSLEIKKQVGYVSSDVRYYSYLKIKDIINKTLDFYHLKYDERIDEMVEYLQIDINKKIGDLSLGNKKKVAIICALLHHPKLIILDEPTNGLDPLIQKRLFDLLQKEIKLGATVFLSSHNLTEVENYCDEVAFIKDGRIFKILDLKNNEYQHTKNIIIKGFNLNFAAFSNLGAHIISRNNDYVHLHYKGDLKKIMAYINMLEYSDLTIENLSLEEEFMDYYKEDK